MTKQRYTLVQSIRFKDETVFAKILPATNGCIGCSFEGVPCALSTPPCTPLARHDGQEVIFVTEVEKW